MTELGSNIVANILATIVIAVLGAIASLLLSLPFVYKKRKHLFAFFGISPKDPNFTAYLSTVFVRVGGANDFRGLPRTFQGPAVPDAELQVVAPIAKLFHHPFLDSLPSSLQKWLGRTSLYFRKVSPTIKPSPYNRDDVVTGNILTVGSQYYNSAADLYTETCNHTLKMEQVGNDMLINVARGPRAAETFRQRQNQADDLAIVEKIYDESTNSTIFFAAGLGTVGTVGAVYYILDNWQKLYTEFDLNPFAICLRFQDVLNDPNAITRPVELARFVGSQ